MTKIVIKNTARIVTEDNIKYVLKRKNKDLVELFNYLDSRSFSYYPKILESNDSEVKYEFIESTFIPDEEKGISIIKIMALLHSKTVYFKTISKRKYKQIYDTLIDNIDYLKDYYLKLITVIDDETYMSPSHYLIARNYSIINGCLLYAEKELNSWFRLVEKKEKERVCIVNNHIDTNHYIRGNNDYLINWDHYIVDTPILDIYKFYKKEYNNYDFEILFTEYNNIFKLNEEEIKLLYVLLSIPGKIEEVDDELLNTSNIKTIIDYIYKTNNLISSRIFEISENEDGNQDK